MNAVVLTIRRVLTVLAVLLFAAFAMTVRVVVDGERQMAQSDAAFNAGDLKNATFYARRAATSYAPGAPHVSRAYERLTAIAVGAEAEGKPKTAFAAWQAIRSAALESRHLWIPHAAELERANQNLTRLSERLRNVPSSEREGEVTSRSRFVGPSGPEPFWVLVLGGGFILMATGLALIALRGMTRDGKWLPRKAWLGVGFAILGAACWTLAVYRA